MVACTLALTACGGGSSSDDFVLQPSSTETGSGPDEVGGGSEPLPTGSGSGNPDPGTGAGAAGTPHAIALTSPVSNSIENLGGRDLSPRLSQ